jgi:SAM-dependent methyltransferase
MDAPYRPHPILWTPERVERLWQYYGTQPAYEEAYFSQHSGGAILDRVARTVALRGRRVVDFGCGRGHLLGHLLARGVACSGIEFSPHSAEVAERKLGGHPLFEGVVRARALPTPLDGASADVVFLVEVLEHLLEDQIAPTLAEIRRILRPHGEVIVTTPHAEDLAANVVHCPECGCTFHRWQHVRSLRPEELSELMRQAGFETELCQAVFFRPPRGWTATLVRALTDAYRTWRGISDPVPHLLYVGRKPASGKRP